MLYSIAEYLQGLVPEIVIHGKTGLVVNTIDEMIEAVRTISLIDPSDCRRHVKYNFSIAGLVGEYSDLHDWIVDERTLYHA
ncbi:hypothetical protein ACFLZQ_07790 [Thermodesulfobacteriota bacterium]